MDGDDPAAGPGIEIDIGEEAFVAANEAAGDEGWEFHGVPFYSASSAASSGVRA